MFSQLHFLSLRNNDNMWNNKRHFCYCKTNQRCCKICFFLMLWMILLPINVQYTSKWPSQTLAHFSSSHFFTPSGGLLIHCVMPSLWFVCYVKVALVVKDVKVQVWLRPSKYVCVCVQNCTVEGIAEGLCASGDL